MTVAENLYYSPDAFGLRIVGEIDENEPYEFNMFVVWQDGRGVLYWASDSGCSCPCPFEDYKSIADLGTGTPAEATRALDEYMDTSSAKPEDAARLRDTLRYLV